MPKTKSKQNKRDIKLKKVGLNYTCPNKRVKGVRKNRNEYMRKYMREYDKKIRKLNLKLNGHTFKNDKARDYNREYSKKYAKSGKSIISVKKWVGKNPEKVKAHWIVKDAIKSGKLKRKLCKKCGNPKVEGHHSDYSKPLKVTWLCRKHHKELHRKLKLLNLTKKK